MVFDILTVHKKTIKKQEENNVNNKYTMKTIL